VENKKVGTSTIPDGSMITGIHINGQFNVKQQPVHLPEVCGSNIEIRDCEVSNIIGKTNDYGSWLDDDRAVIATKTGVILQSTALCPHLSAFAAEQLADTKRDAPTTIPGTHFRTGLDVRGHHIKGVFGIRLVAVTDVDVANTRIAHVENHAVSIGGVCITGTAAGISIRACGPVRCAGNTIVGVRMIADSTRAGDIISE
jgi:hypothetical protein